MIDKKLKQDIAEWQARADTISTVEIPAEEELREIEALFNEARTLLLRISPEI